MLESMHNTSNICILLSAVYLCTCMPPGRTQPGAVARGVQVRYAEAYDACLVLSSLAKGSNRGEEQDNGMAALHLAPATIRSRVWFE